MERRPSPASRIGARTVQVLAAAAVLAAVRPGAMWTAPLYGVGILAVPPVLGRLCRYRLTPLQRVWFSAGLAVHPLGVLYGLYGGVLWYDHLAHALAASLVAGLLYLVVTAASDRERADPPRTGEVAREVHVAVLAGVLAAGAGWELLELAVDYLVVYGVDDTLADVAYDVVGWLAVAPRWRSLLGALPDGLGRRLPGGAGPA